MGSLQALAHADPSDLTQLFSTPTHCAPASSDALSPSHLQTFVLALLLRMQLLALQILAHLLILTLQMSARMFPKKGYLSSTYGPDIPVILTRDDYDVFILFFSVLFLTGAGALVTRVHCSALCT